MRGGSFWLEFADGINEFGNQASHEHRDPHEQDGKDPDDQDEEDDSQELLDGGGPRVKEDCVHRRGEMHQHCCRCRVHSTAIPILIIHTLNQFSLNPSINTNALIKCSRFKSNQHYCNFRTSSDITRICFRYNNSSVKFQHHQNY